MSLIRNAVPPQEVSRQRLLKPWSARGTAVSEHLEQFLGITRGYLDVRQHMKDLSLGKLGSLLFLKICFPNGCYLHLPGLPTKSQGADNSIWLCLALGVYLPLIRATWQTYPLQGLHILFTSKLCHQFYLSFHLQTPTAGQHQVPARFH